MHGAALVAVAGTAGIGYGWLEARRYRLRSHTLPVLPPGAAPVRILQVSDTHLRPGQARMRRFLESLAHTEYDLVLATGDLIGSPESVAETMRLLNLLRARSGRLFVFGSSDYYAPVFKNYFHYRSGKMRHGHRRNPTAQLRRGLTDQGWIDMNNRDLQLGVNSTRLQVTGLDDPYLRRDERRLLARQPGVDCAILVVHDPAPYYDAFSAGYDLAVAGHTHGGQVRVPLVGALVTNSTLPAGLAMGASQIGRSWLFVTPGIGTGKYSPFRFLCPPEASILDLVGKQE